MFCAAAAREQVWLDKFDNAQALPTGVPVCMKRKHRLNNLTPPPGSHSDPHKPATAQATDHRAIQRTQVVEALRAALAQPELHLRDELLQAEGVAVPQPQLVLHAPVLALGGQVRHRGVTLVAPTERAAAARRRRCACVR